jgi:protease secretion system outer membrane protein
LAGLVLSACTASLAQAPAGSGLLDIYRSALEHDPGFRAARQEQQAAQEGIPQAVGARRPEVSVSGGANFNQLDQQVGAFSRTQEYQGGSLALQLRQAIVNRELESREVLARLRAQQADAVLDARRLELTERLVDAYVAYALAAGVQELTRGDLERQQQLIEVARRALSGGEGTTTDVLEATSRADVLRAQLRAAETQRQNAEEQLRSIAGPRVPVRVPRLAGRLPELPLEAGDAEALVLQHPQVRARQLGVDLARESIALARAPYRPRVDWLATASRSESDAVNTVNQTNTLKSLGLQLSVPLYAGGRESSAERQAVLLVGKAEAERDDTAEEVRLKLRQGLRGLQSSQERWRALQSARRSTEQLITATTRSITGGVRSRADLLLAERQLAQVLRDEQQALSDYLRAWWRLTTARGEAEESQLRVLQGAIDIP